MAKKQIICALFAIMMFVTASIAQAAPAASNVDWGNGVITVTGYGTPPARANTPTKRFALARRAAIVDAYRYVAETIQGVNVTAESTVSDLAAENDLINTKVNALIRGAQIVSEEALPDGGYKVTMQVSMYGVSNSLSSIVMPKTETVEPLPERIPVASAPTVSEVRGNYTGVIIDCRGFDVNPIMSPVIRLQDGTPVYGYKNLQPEKVIHFGMAAYSHGQSTVQRAGLNPLVIHAIGMVRHNAYPVISDEDANRMLAENNVSHFLDDCKVVIMRR